MKPNHWIPSMPMYQPGKPIGEVARELGFGDIDEIVKVASNENELGPSPKALVAMRTAASEMHRYPDGGAFHLKQRLAAHLDMDPSHLLPGNGSNELIELLGHVYLNETTNMVVSQYSFIAYKLVGALFHAPVKEVPSNGFAHDLDAMAAAIDDDTRMVIVCNPNNPTGTSCERKELLAFVRSVPSHVLVVVDEAYREYIPAPLRADLVTEIQTGQPNLVVLRTFSKAYGLAGLRIGYAIASPAIVALLNRARQPFHVNAMALAAATAALDDKKHIERSRQMVADGMALFAQRLPLIGNGLEYVPSAANFLLVRTGNGTAVFDALQQQKIIVRPMASYGLPEWVRITIGTPAQNERTLDAVEKILSPAP